MVIAADESWSVPSLSSVRTAPDSVPKLRTPWKLLMWSWSSKRPPPKRASIVPHLRSLTGERFGEVVVVDQSRFSNSRGHHRQRSGLLKSSRVDELRVLELDPGLKAHAGRDPRPQPDGVALP